MRKKEIWSVNGGVCSGAEIDLFEYFRVVFAHRKLFFAALAVSILLAFGASYMQSRLYESSAVIQLAYLSEPLMTDTVVLQELQKESLITKAINRAGVAVKPEILKKNMMLEYFPNANRVRISVKHSDPRAAFKLTSAIVQVFVSTHSASYQRELLSKNTYIAYLESELAILNSKRAEIDALLSSRKDKRSMTKEFREFENLRLQNMCFTNELIYKLHKNTELLLRTTDYGIFEPAGRAHRWVYHNIAGLLVTYVSCGLIVVLMIVLWRQLDKNAKLRHGEK